MSALASRAVSRFTASVGGVAAPDGAYSSAVIRTPASKNDWRKLSPSGIDNFECSAIIFTTLDLLSLSHSALVPSRERF